MAEQPYDYTQEDHIREVERVLMYIDQAQRKAEEIASELARDGAEARFVDGLATAAAALRAEHNRLLNTTHFPVPDEPAAKSANAGPASETLLSSQDPQPPSVDDQQRMAI